MSDFRHQAEAEKLARVLDRSVDDLDYTEHLSAEELRALREQISAHLFDEHSDMFQRLADASKLLPVGISAMLSKRVFGPLFSARISGLLPVERAIAIAKKLDTPFLADLTLELDPRRARDLLAQMPTSISIDVARVLDERGEYVTMARFVDSLTLKAVLAVADTLGDEALLRIGFYVEDPSRLTEIIDHLPDERIDATIQLTATGSEDLRSAGLSLMGEVDDDARRILGESAIRLGDDVLSSMIETASASGDLEVLRRTLACVDEAHRERVAQHVMAAIDPA